MKSLAVDKNGTLSVVEIPVPKYSDYHVLVRMESCGICNGTDLKIIHRAFKNFDTYPSLLGHEGVGRVVEKGRYVKSFKVGDVIMAPYLEGMSGEYYSGWGAFSEYAVVGDWKAMAEDGKGPGTPEFSDLYYPQQIVPEDINPVSASMILTFREVLSAVKRFGFTANSSLVIFGAGPVGLSFIKFSKLLGLDPVIVFDVVDEKLQDALHMGADYVFNSQKVDVKKEVRSICKDGVDFAVDAVGVNQLINQSMELVKFNGKICCYGISPKLNMELDWSKAPYNWTLQFVQWPSKSEEAEAHTQIVNWIRMGVLNPDDFISDIFEFDRILDAFKLVEEKKARKKVVIKF